jgi:hypothetical protein
MTAPLDGIVIELRIGGRFETLMLGQLGSHRMVATFTEVVIHQRHVPEPMRWVAPTYERLRSASAQSPGGPPETVSDEPLGKDHAPASGT